MASTKKRKTWTEKMDNPPFPEVKILEKGFADLKDGSKMLIPTPKQIASYLKSSTPGQSIDMKQMRKDLAGENHADYTCPLTTGIFIRIVAEFTNEQKDQGVAHNELAPVWRVIHPKLPIWKKLTFDPKWLIEMQQREGSEVLINKKSNEN